ncbi:hypothetical protein V2J94_20375 [Streptomyces sp. DSM 41524]|uniref:Uncharacterized protein n=1 Tax=Streptomyces asiaticus subsp. ignotus TaxID=3098222 RepID=A0ABU7PYM1_9ACTN|nr:hypothetical protein [Streptomyces sp. DSM 41524]
MTGDRAGAQKDFNEATAAWFQIVDEFSAQMFSLLHISDTLIPEMMKRERGVVNSLLDSYDSLLSGDDRDEFKQAVNWFGATLGEIVDRIEERRDAEERAAVKDSSGKEDGDPRELSFRINSKNVSTAFGQMIYESTMHAKAGPRDHTLRKSLIVSAASAFEILFGKLAKRVYAVNKAALNDSEYTFSLQQLAEFSSLEEARQYLVERRVSALLRESLDGWDKWLGKSVKGVSMAGLPLDWVATREVFARRNLVVHNGGEVNHIYMDVMSNLDGVRCGSLNIGSVLKIDREYFAQATQNIFSLGMLLAIDVARKLHRDQSEAFLGLLLRNAESAARRHLWVATVALSRYLLNNNPNRSGKIRAQVLNWVARKEQSGVEEIRGEVAAWDVSGLSDEYSHYKRVLIGEKGKAINDVEKLISSGKLSIVEVATHPIYADLVNELPSMAVEAELPELDSPASQAVDKGGEQ